MSFEACYNRVKVLGEGAFGTAYLVSEKRNSSALHVAKEIRVQHLTQKQRELCLAEAEVLRRLSHANIIGYVDSFLEGTRLFIVMEYADNGDLASQIKQKKDEHTRFSEPEIMSVHLQLVLALQHCHGCKILHRDLKPMNVFLSKPWIVKLGDFGISKVLESTTAGAQTTVGTPLYLSPEICNGEPYGTKSDLWSLGVLTYELTALKVPFHATSLPALIMKVCSATPDPLPQQYSRDLEEIVHGFLEKEPRKRLSLNSVLSNPYARHHIERLLTRSREDFGKHAGGLISHQWSYDSQQGRRPSQPTQASGPGATSTRWGSHQDAAREEFLRNRQAALEAKQRNMGIGGGVGSSYLLQVPYAESDPPASRSPEPRPTRRRASSAPQEDGDYRTPPRRKSSKMDRALTEPQSPEESGEAFDHRAAVRRKAQQDKEAKELAHKQELEAARLEAFHDRVQAKQRRESERRLSHNSPAAPYGDPGLSPIRSPQPAGSDRRQELPEPPWTESVGEMTVDPKSLHVAAVPAVEVMAPPDLPVMSREQRELKELQDVLQASLESSQEAAAARPMGRSPPDQKEPDHEAQGLDLTLRPTDLAASLEPALSAEDTVRPHSPGLPARAEPPLVPATPPSPSAIAGPGNQLPAIHEQTHDSLSYSMTASVHDLKDSTLGLTKELEADNDVEGRARSAETGSAAPGSPEPFEEPSPTAKKLSSTPAEACSSCDGSGVSSLPPPAEATKPSSCNGNGGSNLPPPAEATKPAPAAVIADVLEQPPLLREARSESITIGLNVSSERKDGEGTGEGVTEPEQSDGEGSQTKRKCCTVM
eukprot:TRINITY_DN102708_c0_g1_i1.p1 TRINITY_DN102708_c0_g1~~TRINITY_DN102708_c0_g1_i1.p1  ORF type:complete len:821 (-),score=151.37 TRINITY_DN102708_c0_g1_i1:52-2514(-)